jgi:hypothetical protein
MTSENRQRFARRGNVLPVILAGNKRQVEAFSDMP